MMTKSMQTACLPTAFGALIEIAGRHQIVRDPRGLRKTVMHIAHAYAFGDCLVNALCSVFQSGYAGFQAK
jgi:hypothetical protein